MNLSTKDIWLSMSAANGNTFNESGFDYWQWMIDPYIGTNLIQRKIIEKLELDTMVVDWYDNNNIINAYSFVMENFPGWEKAKLIIINSKLMKNAESILISLRDERCPHRLLLSDGGHLDRDFLSDISAQTFEGVHICFQRYKEVIVDVFGALSDNLIRFEIESTHMYLVDYFASYSMSENLQLDGLADRTVFTTKTNIWPPRFIQLLPADHGSGTAWSQSKTWEDQYNWSSMDITNLIRNFLPYEEDWAGQGWPQDETWERWRDWSGRLNNSWHYNKPSTASDPRRDYYENPNYPPTYEPAGGLSLYRPIIRSQKSFESVQDVLSNRSQIVNFWDEFLLSESEYLSPTPTQLPGKEPIARWNHGTTGKGFLFDVVLGAVVWDHFSDENINKSASSVDYWNTYTMSGNKSISTPMTMAAEDYEFVGYNHNRIVTLTNFVGSVVDVWTSDLLSTTAVLSTPMSTPASSSIFVKSSHSSLPADPITLGKVVNVLDSGNLSEINSLSPELTDPDDNLFFC